VARQRDLVVSYLPQDFMLDATKSVEENIRDGAKPVLDRIAEFESLPHDSKRHEFLEHRIQRSKAGLSTRASKSRWRI